MNTGDANQMIVGALAGTVVISAASTLAQKQQPSPRLLLGFVGSGLGLGLIAVYAPRLAASLAMLMLTATIFVTGGPLWDAVTKATE